MSSPSSVFSAKEASLVLAGIVSALAFSVFVLRAPPYWPLALALAACVWLGARRGFALREMARMAREGVEKAMIPICMLTLIGMLMGLWRLNGTAATIALYGSRLVVPGHFAASAFVVCAVVSMAVGTASGATSMIGLPLMMVGQACRVPTHLLAGAIISGVYLGDRSSPVSSVLHMVSHLTATNLWRTFRRLLVTLVPAAALSLAAYWLAEPLGAASTTSTVALALTPTPMPSAAALVATWPGSTGTTSAALLIPPLLLVVMAIVRLPILVNLGTNVALAAVIAMGARNVGLLDVARVALLGYRASGPDSAGVLTSGGGAASMVSVLLVLVFSTALSGLLLGMEVIHAALEGWLARLGSARRTLLATMGFSIVTGMIASNQALAAVLPCTVFAPVYREKGMSGLALAHAVSDSGVIVAPIIPWSAAALGPAAILGIDPAAYVPCAFLCWILPIISVGWVIARRGVDS